MKKHVLFLFCLIAFSAAWSQNYQSIRSNEIRYYATPDLSYILATRTDSVQMNGLDSVFYSYKTVRENDTASSDLCQYLLGPNWYGEKVIIQPNGENTFFNKDLDSIHIQTQAQLDETFLVYVYPSGLDSIFGTVIAMDTLTILGNLDSVKTIQLSTTNSLILLQPSEIMLSKNNGFVTWFAPYSFPEIYIGPMGNEIINYGNSFIQVGKEFPRTGITKPRRGDIYNFDVGDRFIFSYGDSDLSGNWSNNYVERTVISKNTFGGTDSVSYQLKDTVRHKVHYEGFGTSVIYNGYTNTVKYKNLTELNDSLLPEEFNLTYQNSWNYLGLNECQRLVETRYETSIGLSDWPNSNCIEGYNLSFGYYFFPYITGVGELTYSGLEYGYPMYYNSALTYYSKVSEDTCGTNSYLALDEIAANTFDFTVYPNPATTYMILKMQTTSNENCHVSITDLQGRIFYTEKVAANELQNGHLISTADFDSGIYFVTVYDGENRVTQKLICHP